MKKIKYVVCALLILITQTSFAALQTRFEVINFDPAVDKSDYFTIYSSQTLKAWQGNLGIYFDYANKPLQFVATGAATGRQSVIDHMFVVDLFGAIGFTDWFSVGLLIPAVPYNVFFTDDAAAQSDHGGDMGDIKFVLKFRAVDTNKHRVGLAFMPFFTLPTGDVTRYTGNGNITGGLNLVTDFIFHERFTMALNVGYTMRDGVVRNGVTMDDQMTYGLGANLRVTKNFHIIAEIFGTAVIKDLFGQSNASPMEAGAGIRYHFKDSGFALSVGGNAGIIEGVGSPKFRGYIGLNWVSPISEECPECPPPAPPPDPRVQKGKILIWGKIFYDTDKATIKEISYAVLDDVVSIMQRNPQIKLVEVQGHTDARATDAYNMKLSQRRAESAMNYLIAKGIDPSRLTPKGYGESKPIADNTSKEGMSQNRRTEFVILSQDEPTQF